MSSRKVPEGAAWLLESPAPEDVFFPEDFSEEQRAFAASMDDFVNREVTPKLLQMETQDHTVLLSVMAKLGESGFLGIEIPEAYVGGLGQGLVTASLVFERLAYSGSASLAATYGAHTGIGTVPVLLYGNDDQKSRYLPDLASGKRIAAYALTEPGSGSDALAAKATAELSVDKARWILNGSKLFITNGGFADLFTVFAKVGGKNACFLVEGNVSGLIREKEQEKIGLHGSSTVPLSFERSLVNATNLLGELGKGHKIVMNTLNVGRLKLAAAKCGLIKLMLSECVKHASQRAQFGKPLIEYEAIRAKLADMAVDGWVGEAITYRTAALLEDRIHAGLPLEQLSQECALVKVALSEWGCDAADEAVQVHGGIGYTKEMLVGRAYCDARISRIYEGTSEINRFAIIDGIGKQVASGKLALLQSPEVTRWDEWTAENADKHPDKDPAAVFAKEIRATYGEVEKGKQVVPRAKAAVRFILAQAIKTHMLSLAQQQALLLELADAVIAVYAMESAELRYEKLLKTRGAHSDPEAAALHLCYDRQSSRIEKACETVLMTLPDAAATIEYANSLLRRMRLNTVDLRRRVAKAVVEKGGYPY